ncbi:hypothetical protein AB0J83_43085 [Actinoplanes sp. NPDC049596]|uniref:hypothetical protein n=1 Tax=unclassified Actinoplanes TaxID=2626549 RepID=UPI003428EA9D
MTVSSLVTALAIGTLLGLAARRLRRAVPFWVPLAVAVGAAMLATVLARLAGLGTTAEVLLQTLFAATGIVLVAATADRYPDPGNS